MTDYSSHARRLRATGLPLLCFGYDLDEYAETVRGFYVPFAETVPAPLLRTEGELTEALADPVDAVRASSPSATRGSWPTFCALDDGGASARVADRVFS